MDSSRELQRLHISGDYIQKAISQTRSLALEKSQPRRRSSRAASRSLMTTQLGLQVTDRRIQRLELGGALGDVMAPLP